MSALTQIGAPETCAPRDSSAHLRGAAENTTAVAMSGGVDSSTVAAILRERHESIVGLTMQLWNQRRLPQSTTSTTPAASPSISVFLSTW